MDQNSAAYFEDVAKGRDGKMAANWVINELFGRLNKEGKDIADSPVSASQLGAIIDLIIGDNTISGKIAKDVFEIAWTEGGDPADRRGKGPEAGHRHRRHRGSVDEVIAANPDKVKQARKSPSLPAGSSARS
jgi:aspartyl-tRNA(Asn)/glutamyl-tRNA(Gln) amidotransferase subunit B